ncbi:MAG: ABC transporter permease [Proteobacteria bacterium]|nr:ABC transporter permease [Pseudomonadota bacterium]MCH9758690.1 ABC transporter permease [Pseudomonadota bacterium]
MRLQARTTVLWQWLLFAPVAAVVSAFTLCALLIVWADASVWEAYALVIKGAVGSRFGITETLTRATPLIFTGLAAAAAFRAKLWNIGGEGQFYMGALVATVLGTGLLPLPAWLLIPLLLIAGAAAGGVTLLLPTLLKARYRVDEVVTTLLLNFIILLFVSYLLDGPIKDPMSLGWPQAKSVIDEGVIPPLIEKSRLHYGFIFALLASTGFWLLLYRMRLGYEIRAVGSNPIAARFAGIKVNRVLLKTALLSGGIAGIGGVCELAGLKGYLTLDISPGFGYSGIAVAMLALLHPLAVAPAAIFISAVFVGTDSMSRALNIPSYLADVLVASSILLVMVFVLFSRYRIVKG